MARPLLALAAALALALAGPAHAQVNRCPMEGVPAGNRTAMIKAVQQELAMAGFDAGKPDGILGRNTRQSIQAYQKAARMDEVTGCPSEALLDRLRFALPKVYSPNRPQDPTQTVQIQEELLRRGYWPGPADGRFGPRTREAIRQFEIDLDRPVTGEASAQLLTDLKTSDMAARRD